MKKFILFITLSLAVEGASANIILKREVSSVDTIPGKSMERIKGLQIVNITREKIRKSGTDFSTALQPGILYIGIDNVIQVKAEETLKDIGASVENGSLIKVGTDSFVIRVTSIMDDFKIDFYIVSQKGETIIREIQFPVRTIPQLINN